MAQDPIDWQPYNSTSDNSQIDWQPYKPPRSGPEPYDPNDWGDWIMDKVLGTGPMIAGGAIGSVVGAGPWGTAIGSGVGAALGSTLSSSFRGEEIKPATVAVEGAAGMLPFFGEVPGAGATAKEVLAYAGRGALQGAGQAAVASAPRHIAETGKWELPSFNEFAGQTIGGGLVGGGISLAHGGLSSLQKPHIAEVPAIKPFSDDLRAVRQANLFPPEEFPSPVSGARELRGDNSYLGLSDPTDMSPLLNMGQHGVSVETEPPPRGVIVDQGPFANENGQLNLANQRPLDPNEHPMMFNRPRQPVEPPPVNLATEGPETVKITDFSTMKSWQDLGYVNKGQDAKGFITMVRPDLAEGFVHTIPPLKTGFDTLQPKENYVTEGEPVHIPNANVNENTINSMAENGYRMGEKSPTHTTFVPVENFDPSKDIAFAKVKGGGLVIDSDNRRAAINITKDYSSPLSGIMVREGLQNALDAADMMGVNGHVRVRTNANSTSVNPNTIEIHDNGHGLDETALSEKLARLFASGKSDVAGATGGKGIGSASYILGGQHFEIDTVAVDSTDGIKYRIKASGTPEQFLDQTHGSEWEKTPVSRDTPTGTSMKVLLKDDQEMYSASGMVKSIIDHTRDRPSKITYDPTGIVTDGRHISELEPKDLRYTNDDGQPQIHNFAPSRGDKKVADFTLKDNDIKILVPNHDPSVERRSVEVHYLNNGMYQFSRELNLGQKIKGVPEHILVNINPKIDELHANYPFTNTREHLKSDVQDAINTILEKRIKGPAVERYKNRVQELYDSMVPVQIHGTERKAMIFDPGNRMTPEEMDLFVNHPTTQSLLKHYDGLVDDILRTSGHSDWEDRVEGVGLIFDPESNGMHIPNPTSGKSTIMFSPFARAENGVNALDNAWKGTITAIHEAAHVGTEVGESIKFSDADRNDPRMAKFFESYLEQLNMHGDTGWSHTGHDMTFGQRLGELYATFGVGRTYEAANQLEEIFTGGKHTSEYSPEFQELLQLYQESRGRDPVTEDLLSRTGVKQSATEPTGEGIHDGDVGSDGTGPPVAKGKKQPSLLKQWYNLPRGLTTPLDLSDALRQGSPLVFTKAWRDSWGPRLKSLGSEGAYQKTLSDIRKRPLFASYIDNQTGKRVPSWAESVGLKLADLVAEREEATPSNWAESGEFLNKIPGAAKTYKETAGRAVRATDRAYTAGQNQLRADTFENLINDSYREFQAGKNTPNPFEDLKFAKEIADYVNTATGRAPLKLARPSFDRETGKWSLKESNLEKHAQAITDVMFSPRLMFSRMRMLNPMTYSMASPFVRKQYLKSALSVAGFWGTVATTAALAGADVSTDTNSADFGKIKIGNTRIDPGAGFQQYLVALSRLITGHDTSSNTGKDFETGQGYRPVTRLGIAQNFAANKLHPVMKFGYDMLNASQHQPFPVSDRIAQLFVPLIVGDVIDLAKEDPKLLPLIAPIAAGMGSQTYSKGEQPNKFIPKDYDYNFTGGEWFGDFK